MHTVMRSGQLGELHAETDELAEEVAVALEYNDISHATLLASPTHLEDLAIGFSYTEGIIRSASDIYDIDIVKQPQGWVIQLHIASACLNQLKQRRRQMAGRTGCGLCGLETLSQVQRELTALPAPQVKTSPAAILLAAEGLRASQPLHKQTGATHGAAWATQDGTISHTREDVGRHNALDKLIGSLLRQKTVLDSGFFVISSRASFEMVQKTVAAGVSTLVAVSAPTSYAVRLATDLNLMLTGFVRGEHFTVYSHPEFLLDPRNSV
ncbi:formate dehydrogenase accessory sulfurtransferase FdhD [Alcaligenaceae bacterium]|nr:formate dehydrogenase accessory sulfurtransferase FdhD [Alcaligenaceae bacterium]